MNEQDYKKIAELLDGLYGRKPNWYVFLKDYPYEVTKRAVLDFARNDSREYAVLPPVKRIIAPIIKKIRPTLALIESAKKKASYDSLASNCGISPSQYLQIVLLEDEIEERKEEIINFCCGGTHTSFPPSK